MLERGGLWANPMNEQLACGRELHSARQSFEQFGPQILFNILDSPLQGRGRDVSRSAARRIEPQRAASSTYCQIRTCRIGRSRGVYFSASAIHEIGVRPHHLSRQSCSRKQTPGARTWSSDWKGRSRSSPGRPKAWARPSRGPSPRKGAAGVARPRHERDRAGRRGIRRRAARRSSCACDLTDAANCERCVAAATRRLRRAIDILVNVAGGSGPIGKTGVGNDAGGIRRDRHAQHDRLLPHDARGRCRS